MHWTPCEIEITMIGRHSELFGRVVQADLTYLCKPLHNRCSEQKVSVMVEGVIGLFGVEILVIGR
jgi:hypothetical protein